MERPIRPPGAASSTEKVPTPSHRHAAPSAPWPFVDIDDIVDPARIEDPDSHLVLSAVACEHKEAPGQEVCWCKYPQALYPNWTPRQQKKAKLTNILKKRTDCTIHYLDVHHDGSFADGGIREVNDRTVDSHWVYTQQGRSEKVHLRLLFVEKLSGDVMRILGTHYNLEPFFFSSTIGWIPSRHQSHLRPNESDHLTVALTFVRPISIRPGDDTAQGDGGFAIDTRVPLNLRSKNINLVADQLSVHMLRSRKSNTIISLQADSHKHAVSAKTLHSRVRAAGRSVYWSNIFKDTTDPTFVLLTLLWYALYAWDEALEHLYNHICFLETEVIETSEMQLSHELHVIRAHLLHYEDLLDDFKKTVHFIGSTPNPSIAHGEVRKQSSAIMKRECENMLTEISRLEKSREMQDARVKNVMDLTFSMANIEDSKRVQLLTEASMKDSAAIKQISYLTMAFAPAGFVAAVFGMNVKEINPGSFSTLGGYFGTAIPLTLLATWVIVAYQIQIPDPHAEARRLAGEMDESGQTPSGFKRLDLWTRIWWPAIVFSTFMERRKMLNERRSPRIVTD